MYPQPDLAVLDGRKRALTVRIRERRSVCAGHFREMLKPVAWIDGVREKWRSVSPLTKFVALPAGLFVARKALPRFGSLLAWAPVAFRLFRALR
jgi:hypothetical protein